MAEYSGFPATLQVDTAAGTAISYTTVAQVRDITGPSLSRNTEEASHRGQTDQIMTYIPGMTDPGEITFDGILDFAAAQATALFDNMKLGPCDASKNWKLNHNFCAGGGTAYWLFDGFVTSYELGLPLEGPQTLSVTVKVTNTIAAYFSSGGA